jgi:DNA-binding CsgD family transcriptional regulator/PAS domain-containing protein
MTPSGFFTSLRVSSLAGVGGAALTRLNHVSAKALSETIGAIYDCAISPEHWPEALRKIAELTGSAAAGMGIVDHRLKQSVRLYDYGYQEDDLRIYHEKYGAMNPALVARLMFPVGEPVAGEMLVDEEEWLDSRIYREFLEPRDLRYGATIELLRTPHRSVGAALMRKHEQGAYGAEDLSLLRLLSPHLCRSLTIADALDLRTLHSEMLEVVLDGLAAGVYLTARDGNIVYMNAAAEKQARLSGAIRIANNRLRPTDQEAHALLAKAIDELSKDEAKGEVSAHSIALPEPNGAGYVATVLPLESGRRAKLAPFAASVGIFVQDPQKMPLMPVEAFARLYRLSGAELRVLLRLAQGGGATEAAETLGISEATVRTHLRRLFFKTGTARQAELLQLLQNAAPPTSTS